MALAPLSDAVLIPFVETALKEDLGDKGDITSNAIIPEDKTGTVKFTARQEGIIAGIGLARIAFQLVSASVHFRVIKTDGDFVGAGEVIAEAKGQMRAILAAERTALNFLSHLSGIASATRKLVEAVKPHKTRVSCTRKTTPGLRILEKYAVQAGGGVNHRFGLYDAVLIKDNHIAAIGDIRSAIIKAREAVGNSVKVEVEVDNLEQLEKILDLPLDAVLLDNMSTDMLTKAVKLVNRRFETEASGGISPANAGQIAATGVDVISSGWITHSAPALDIGLDFAGS